MKNINISEIEQLSRERVIYLIENFCDGNRMEFAKRCGIGKSSVSQYVNGTNVPGNITASKIGEAFKVNPMWVMGFDNNMNIAQNSEIPDPSDILSEDKKSLITEIMKEMSTLSPEELSEIKNSIEYLIFKRNR